MFFEEMMNSYWNKKAGKKKGFTLVEMMVVVAIIAVLTSIVIPVVGTHVTKARAATNAANLRAAKGAFTTVKLMNPEDYTAWTGGVKALTGVEAKDQEFEVGSTEVKVPAPNAVEMTDGDLYIAEGTVMKAQIYRDENGDDQVYVTYNDLPISYFAEVAEKGTADPTQHQNTSVANTAIGKEFINRYQQMANDLYKGMNGTTVLDMSMYGSLPDKMKEIADNPETQGDCLKCAMNNIDIYGEGGLLGTLAGSMDSITTKFENMGYKYQEGVTQICLAYDGDGTTTATGACSCGHGPESHISRTSKVDMDKNISVCSKGGVHEYDTNHVCTKCKYDLPDKVHKGDDSVPYLGSLVNGNCKYCGLCTCCAQTGSDQRVKVIKAESDWSLLIGQFQETITVPYGYQVAEMEVKGFTGKVDAGVCMSLDPVMGGNDIGCGHTKEAHRAADN